MQSLARVAVLVAMLYDPLHYFDADRFAALFFSAGQLLDGRF